VLYAFVIVRLDHRDLVWINVTTNPTAEWIARQITAAFPWNVAPRYLICDWAASTAISSRGDTVRWALLNRWLIGSIRRECLDHIVVLGEPHLRRILWAYARY
jgi:hypothetical protein